MIYTINHEVRIPKEKLTSNVQEDIFLYKIILHLSKAKLYNIFWIKTHDKSKI